MCTDKDDGEDDDDLVDGVKDYVLEHEARDHRVRARVRRAVEQLVGRRVGGEREGRERVLYEIDPQQLQRAERVVLHKARAHKRHEHCRQVHCQLKLQEPVHQQAKICH